MYACNDRPISAGARTGSAGRVPGEARRQESGLSAPARVDDNYVTAPASIVTLAAYGLLGNTAAIILPIIVGALMDTGLSARVVGFAESADMGGIALGALLWSRLILRVNWRLAAGCAIPVAVAGNLMCALLPAIGPVIGGRFLSGFGSGLLAAIGSSGLAQTRRPERVYGLSSTANMMVAAGFVYAFTFIGHRQGSAAVFGGVACIIAVCTLGLKFLPTRSPEARRGVAETRTETVARSAAIRWGPAGLMLAGIWAYFVAALVFWTYAERVAVAAGFSTPFTARSLGFAQIMGACGALSTAVLASYFLRRLPSVVGYIAIAISAALLLTNHVQPWPFFAAVCMLSFSWSGIYPYFIGTVVALDPTARLVSLTITISFIGKSMAPPIAGYLARGTDYSLAYYFSAAFFLVCLALLLMPVLRADRAMAARDFRPQTTSVAESGVVAP